MTNNRSKSITSIFLANMGWPVFWGGLLTVGFYALLRTGIVDSPIMQRYFAAHPVQYFEATLFFVGVAAIVIKLMNVVGQYGTLNEIEIISKPEGGQEVEDAHGMLDSLTRLPNYARRSYLARRLEQALEFVVRKGSSVGLDRELKHLSDMDAGRQHEGFALVRIIIWATPMLGFLGTVIGITLALSDLSPQALVATPESAMDGLLAGLAVAFDTTALALILSMILMFAQYLTSSLETELLEAVDQRVEAEFVGRFKQIGTESDPHVASVETMSHKVLTGLSEMSASTLERVREMSDASLRGMESLVDRQAALWKDSITDAQETWNSATHTAGNSLEANMSQALRDAMRDHSMEMSQSEQMSNDRAERHWRALQDALNQNAHVMQKQQAELVRQGDALLETMAGITEVNSLQQSLNENLSALSVSGKLDETITSLSAAINLLNARLSPAETARRVRVYSEERGEAA